MIYHSWRFLLLQPGYYDLHQLSICRMHMLLNCAKSARWNIILCESFPHNFHAWKWSSNQNGGYRNFKLQSTGSVLHCSRNRKMECNLLYQPSACDRVCECRAPGKFTGISTVKLQNTKRKFLKFFMEWQKVTNKQDAFGFNCHWTFFTEIPLVSNVIDCW